jgi:hypothetical protein
MLHALKDLVTSQPNQSLAHIQPACNLTKYHKVTLNLKQLVLELFFQNQLTDLPLVKYHLHTPRSQSHHLDTVLRTCAVTKSSQ